jgi:hypothetical protein
MKKYIFATFSVFLLTSTSLATQRMDRGVDWRVRNSTIIGTGTVVSTEMADSEEGIARIGISPDMTYKGTLKPGVKNANIKGPPVKKGEEVLFFAAVEIDSEISLVSSYSGLISPSNIKKVIYCDLSLDSMDIYDLYKEAVIRGIDFYNATQEFRNKMAVDFILSSNEYLRQFIVGEINSAVPYGKLPGEKPYQSFDPTGMVTVLMDMIKGPDKHMKLSAFGALEQINDIDSLKGNFLTECMDAAMVMMADGDRDVRMNGYNYAKWRTSLIPEGKTALDVAWEKYGQLEYNKKTPAERTAIIQEIESSMSHHDFGYDPDAPQGEREAALERWKAWWKENRCKGKYLCGEEWAKRKKEIEAKREETKKYREEFDKKHAAILKWQIDRGEVNLDPDDPNTYFNIKLLKRAGYIITHDGKVLDPPKKESKKQKVGETGGSRLGRFFGCTRLAIAGDQGDLGSVIPLAALLALMLLLRRRR